MLFSHKKSLEDFIVQELARNDFSADTLWKLYSKLGKQVTIQAVYRDLRKLAEDGIVLKHKELYSLNNIWKTKTVALLKQANTPWDLEEGESITYSFKSFSQLDQYWKHIQEDVKESVDVVYYFVPHQFWPFVPGSMESEREFYKWYEDNKKKAVLLLGGNTESDKQMKKMFANKFVQVHTSDDLPFRMTDSVSVNGDLIIRTRLPFGVTNKIHRAFVDAKSIKELAEELTQILSKKIPTKIIIEMNAKKAEKLKAQIGKYFY